MESERVTISFKRIVEIILDSYENNDRDIYMDRCLLCRLLFGEKAYSKIYEMCNEKIEKYHLKPKA